MNSETFETDSRISDLASAIGQILSMPVVLDVISEEALEFAHAAMKLKRSILPDNPTPVSSEQAVREFNEEYNDLLVALMVWLEVRDPGFGLYENQILIEGKLSRWFDRLHRLEVDS